MTKKVLKEQQQETREIVKQIFTLALAINSNCTQREATGEKPTVFVGFSGHIAGVHVEIYGKGWDSGDDDSLVLRYLVYLGDEMFTTPVDEYEPYPEEKECEQLSEAKVALAELQKIADKWGVDYCDICRCTPCAPTCPNAEPDLYCHQCGEKIRKGRKYLTAENEHFHRVAFCSMDCLKDYYDVEEEEA